MLSNWVSSTNHTYLKEPSWDVVLQRQFPDASHTLPWCFSVACQMPSDAFGSLSYVSHVVQITRSSTCSCMLSLVFFFDWICLWNGRSQHIAGRHSTMQTIRERNASRAWRRQSYTISKADLHCSHVTHYIILCQLWLICIYIYLNTHIYI